MSIQKISIIMWREFRELVKSKAFLTLGLVFPVMLIAGPGLFPSSQPQALEITVLVRAPKLISQLLIEGVPGSQAEIPESAFIRYQAEPGETAGSKNASAESILKSKGASILLDINAEATDVNCYYRKLLPPSIFMAIQQQTCETIYYQRTQDSKISGSEKNKLLRPVNFQSVSTSNQTVQNIIKEMFLPLAVIISMTMLCVFSSSPAIESVLEEKSDGIADLILTNITARELILGKVLGCSLGSLTLSAAYGIASIIALASGSVSLKISVSLAVWYILFSTSAVLLYSTLFMLVGTLSKKMRDAQAMLLPVWLLLAIPSLAFVMVMFHPDSFLAKVLPFLPTSAPFVMTAILAARPDNTPLWQPVTSLAGVVVLSFLLTYVVSCLYVREPGK